MIKPYGPKRCLVDNAMPTLHLPNVSVAADSISTSSAEIDTTAALESSENVRNDSNFVSTEPRHINVTTVRTANVVKFNNKIRRYRVLLRNKKRVIQRMKQQVLPTTNENTWENITADLPSIQRIFLNMIRKNFKQAPQVFKHLYIKSFNMHYKTVLH